MIQYTLKSTIASLQRGSYGHSSFTSNSSMFITLGLFVAVIIGGLIALWLFGQDKED